MEVPESSDHLELYLFGKALATESILALSTLMKVTCHWRDGFWYPPWTVSGYMRMRVLKIH